MRPAPVVSRMMRDTVSALFSGNLNVLEGSVRHPARTHTYRAISVTRSRRMLGTIVGRRLQVGVASSVRAQAPYLDHGNAIFRNALRVPLPSGCLRCFWRQNGVKASLKRRP